MKTIVSVATSADGYMDDCTTKRLVLSNAEDWAEVHRLRRDSSAILVGAETLRRDNPSLSIKEPADVRHRIEQGMTPDVTKVIISGECRLSPDMRIFTTTGEKIIFTHSQPPQWMTDVATVIRTEHITAAEIVTELEKRGCRQLMIEGGARSIKMFLDAGVVDELRLAINSDITVGDPRAPHLDLPQWVTAAPHTHRTLGRMSVDTYTLHPDTDEDDLRRLQQAIDLSRLCTPSATSYCVGAVIVTAAGEVFEGYTHQSSPTNHAEQEAIRQACDAGADLRGATIYSSMEPCSSRKSEQESCSELIIRHGFARVVFALYEPSCFVSCHGALNMRLAGIRVSVLTTLASQVSAINGHICDKV